MNSNIHFRLYVAGDAPYSQKAVLNLRRYCEAHVSVPHEIEIIDLFAEPGRALADKVLLTPTLLITTGSETRRIVGDLSDTSAVADVIPPGILRT